MIYNVFINYEFKCTYGLKFNIGLRIKCKHISFIKDKYNQLKKYQQNDENNYLLSQFSNLTL